MSEEEARALWKRAVEFQPPAERDEANETALVERESRGLSLDQVLDAAEEAGIPRDHVRLALAERRLPDGHEIQGDQWTARWFRTLVADLDAIDVSYPVRATPVRVLDAVKEVTAGEAFRMELEDTLGEDLIRDGVLIYRSPGSSFQKSSSFHGALEVADARVILVTIRPEGEGARLRLRAPLYERGTNLVLAGGSAGLLGTGGAAGGAALGELLAGLAAVATGAVVAGPAVLGGLAGGGLGVLGFRRLVRWGWRKGEAALDRMARAVALEAEGRFPGISERSEGSAS